MNAEIELVGIYNNKVYLINRPERLLEGIEITEELKRNLFYLVSSHTIREFNSFEELENVAFGISE